MKKPKYMMILHYDKLVYTQVRFFTDNGINIGGGGDYHTMYSIYSNVKDMQLGGSFTSSGLRSVEVFQRQDDHSGFILMKEFVYKENDA